MEERHELSTVNKQLLEAAFYGTLSEKVEKSTDTQSHTTNPLKSEENGDIDAEGEKDTEASKVEWTDAHLLQLQKAVKTVANAGKKKLQVPGFHAIQGLRKARESGWSVKDEGPANAEKYGIKFWGEVAKLVTSPEKYGIKRSPDECIDAYVRQHDPCISGTVLEKLLTARADPNIFDRVRSFVSDRNLTVKFDFLISDRNISSSLRSKGLRFCRQLSSGFTYAAAGECKSRGG